MQLDSLTTNQTRERGKRRWVTVCQELRKVRSRHRCAEITASGEGIGIQGWLTFTPGNAMEFAAPVLIAATQADEIISGGGTRSLTRWRPRRADQRPEEGDSQRGPLGGARPGRVQARDPECRRVRVGGRQDGRPRKVCRHGGVRPTSPRGGPSTRGNWCLGPATYGLCPRRPGDLARRCPQNCPQNPSQDSKKPCENSK